jgi:hypothetical protein
MRFGLLIAAAASLALSAGQADAQTSTTTKQRVARGDHTVVVSRGEDGRTRTRIIVQKRSFLDPGTQVFPGENRYNSGPALVWQPSFSSGPDRGTIFDRGQPPLPGRFDLPFRDNPVGRPD